MKKSFFAYQHLLWDWNGTLLNDVWLCVDIMNTMLRKRKKPQIDQNQYVELFDFPVKTYYQRVGLDFSQEPFETLAAEYIREYDRRQRECALCHGVPELLQRCQEHGMVQSLLSASQQERLEQIVTAFHLRPFFQHLSGLTDYYATSKVANGEALLRQVNMASHDVLLIGDTTHDFEVARALGVDCVLVDGGHHSRRKLETTDAMVTCSLRELTAV
ncbi:HAD family hydrolase [bacterium]|nr:HAD family hydrolase [bacterium]